MDPVWRSNYLIMGIPPGVLTYAAGSLNWDPAHTGSNVTLSAANITATNPNGLIGPGCTVGTKGRDMSGAWQYKLSFTSSFSQAIAGICNNPAIVNVANYAGSDATGYVGEYSTPNFKGNNAAFVNVGGLGVSSGTVDIVIVSGSLYAYLNGTAINGGTALYTGLSGIVYPLAGWYSDSYTFQPVTTFFLGAAAW